LKFLIDLLKFTIFFLVFNYLFIDIEFNKAIFISVISYSGPKLIDYVCMKIKNKYS